MSENENPVLDAIMEAELREGIERIAQSVWMHYCAVKKAGFSDCHAIELAKVYYHILLMRVLNGVNDSR